MKLMFIWIKKYGCFKDMGFNFNPMQRFQFDSKTAILNYYQSENIIENIFGQPKNHNGKEGRIINISAIVGNNGTGKTTLLEIIFNNLIDGEGGIKSEAIFVLESDNRLEMYYNYISNNKQPKKIYLKTDESYLCLFNLNSNNEIRNELSFNEISNPNTIPSINKLNETHFIYVSNTFDNRYYSYNKTGNISDLSTVSLIKSDYQMDIDTRFGSFAYDINLKFFYSEFSRQIRFITEYKNYDKFIPFNLPKNVIVRFANFDNKKDEICKRIDDENIVKKIEQIYNYGNNRNYLDKNEIIHAQTFKQNIAQRIVIMILNDFLNEPGKKGLYPELKDAFKYSNEVNDGIWIYVMKLLEQIYSRLKKSGNYSAMFVERYMGFMRWIDQHIDEIGDFSNIYYEGYFVIHTFKNETESISIKEFFEQYKKTAYIIEYLNFSWGLSTGENNLISLFSRFFSITKEINGDYYLKSDGSGIRKYYKKAIILIDEADLTFHPSWQQQFLKLLLDFIKDIYRDCEIQIIITTHSPIILSDIPKNNVIFLKAEDNKIIVDDNSKHYETFGAHISTLFYDSFFMKKGSIGEFAKDKINKVLEKVKPNINGEAPTLQIGEERELKQIIGIIGDDVIRNKLSGMLDNCPIDGKNAIEEIDEQIKKLEAKKRKLQGDIK